MKTDISNSEIDQLEKVLSDFQSEWQIQQREKATKWRVYFLISFIVSIIIITNSPAFWWLGVVVISYFAGSLYAMLRQRAKTNHQILEHQKQLQLVRLLRKFQASPYSKQ